MRNYHFQLFRENGERLDGHFVVLENDREAEDRAKRMLGLRGVFRVEVWGGDNKLVCEAIERRRRPRREPSGVT